MRPRSELRELVRLALPLAGAQLGNQAMSFVDTAMVGRLGPASLGAIGIGNGIYFALSVVGMGVVLGMDPLVSQAVGAREPVRARQVLREGLRIATLVSLPL